MRAAGRAAFSSQESKRKLTHTTLISSGVWQVERLRYERGDAQEKRLAARQQNSEQTRNQRVTDAALYRIDSDARAAR